MRLSSLISLKTLYRFLIPFH